MSKVSPRKGLSERLVVQRYLQHPRFNELMIELDKFSGGDRLPDSSGIRAVEVVGLTGSSKACLSAALYEHRSLLIIAEDEQQAGYWYSDLTRLLPQRKIYFFPSGYRKHIKYGNADTAFAMMRTEVLTELAGGATPLIVSYPEALAESIPARTVVEEHLISLSEGSTVDRQELKETLGEWGFEVTDYVYEPGQMAFRGSIVDIFSFHSEWPVRIDFLDDEIDSIRYFDLRSQLSVQSVEQVHLVPCLSSGREEQGESLLSALKDDYVVWIERLEDTRQRVDSLWKLSLEQDGVQESEAVSKLDWHRQLVAPPLLMERLYRFPLLVQEVEDKTGVLATIFFHTLPQPLYHKNFERLIEGIQEYRNKGYTIFLLTDAPSQEERLRDILTEREASHLIPERLPLVLHEGFEDSELSLLLLTDHQLFDRFHKYNLKSDRIRNADMAITLQDLSSFHLGDYVVHNDHGVGQFDGLITTEVAGKPQEVVKLLYRDGDVIFVSLHSLHKLSKYRGKEELPPQLNKIGTGAWQRIKDRTKKKIKDIARDLIALYAARKEKEGFAFSADSYLQHELEASFLYEDTPDQLLATRAVKQDMESKRPMDRLICGDVGFGKTEIAIRAAFKAVADNKQVAVLVPTTILAYQHYRTFSSRLEEFPCRIDYISRSKSSKQIKQTLQDLKNGKVDIIIGTHRLVSKDVHFKDLGLLVIDEEQKFGVAVKEKLRRLQVNVDTLTLSATPIPRTLQFSLMGARDLSNINTPPANRLPVSTSLVRFSKEFLQEAIRFELSRNGQVYVVHNRIRDIDDLRTKVQESVPEARIAVAHGRMDPGELEQLLVDFSRHEYDVLIATSIVENGIDVPNANTIIIDRAHHFGLSDLHQLRGRVGRSNRKAFCYLITPPLDALPDDARRRVKAIETFSDLGSGIRVAMQDLDIRGAGNILGAEQSGFIADLGFDTYRRVFDEAVREVKMEEFPDLFADAAVRTAGGVAIEATVETDLDLSFPSLYVPLDSERINLYRRIDNLQSQQEQEEFAHELEDRFGSPLPESVIELLQVPHLRRLGSRLGLEKIILRRGMLTLHLLEDEASPYYTSIAFDALIAYVAEHHSTCEFKENDRGRKLVRVHKITSISLACRILETIENRISTLASDRS